MWTRNTFFPSDREKISNKKYEVPRSQYELKTELKTENNSSSLIITPQLHINSTNLPYIFVAGKQEKATKTTKHYLY